MDRGELNFMETGPYHTIKRLEKEVEALKKENKVLKAAAQVEYIRGYKEGRRTANDGGMN